jgi:hypothetical protein
MRVVSLRLRLLAAFVDAATVGSGMAACIGAVIAGVVGYSRRRGDKGAAYGEAEGGQHDDGQGESDAIEDDAPSRVDRAPRGSRQSPELQVALRGASAGLAIASRNWRSPGFRLIGLRRVDAHTGGGVTVRSALAGVMFDEAWQAAWRPLFRSRAKRHQTRLRALAPQLRAVERNNRGDPQARSRALTEFYRSNPVSPAGGCGWLAAGPLASQLALALSSREGRTIRDRITGTAVIVDRWAATSDRSALIEERKA